MKDIIGIGRALVDGYSENEDSLNFFTKLLGKLPKGNSHLQLSHEQAISVISKFPPKEFHRGGSIANTIIRCSNLGNKNSFIGTVGKDKLGDVFLSELKRNQVKSLIQICDELPTGFTFLLNCPRKNIRLGLHYYGASDIFEFDDNLIKEIESHKLIYSSAYEFTFSLGKKIQQLYKHLVVCPRKLKVISLGGYTKKTLIGELYELNRLLFSGKFDIVIGNKEEYCTLFCSTDIDDEVLQRTKDISSIGVITLAENGSVVIKSDSIYRIPSYRHKKFHYKCVGAGDAYSAGFLTGIIKGNNILEAGEIGTYEAYLKIRNSIS